jgi:hypothetical protein
MRRAVSDQLRKVRAPLYDMPYTAEVAVALAELNALERLLSEAEPETPRTSRMK